MRPDSLKPRRLALTLAAAVVVLDQVTKAWAVAALSDGAYDIITGFLRFRLYRNPGAAFGILQGSGVALAFVGIGIVVGMVFLLDGLHRRWDAFAVGLVLGGAVGNLVDRVVRGDGAFDGKVVDFIDFSFFPSFNVADSAITIGIGLILLGSLLAE